MPQPADLVRVRLENGTHATMPRAVAAAAGLTPTGGPALSRDGRPLPTVPRITPRPRVATPATGRSRSPRTRRTASKSEED